MPRINPQILMLADRFGICFPGAIDYRDSQVGRIAEQRLLALDAAPAHEQRPAAA